MNEILIISAIGLVIGMAVAVYGTQVAAYRKQLDDPIIIDDGMLKPVQAAQAAPKTPREWLARMFEPAGEALYGRESKRTNKVSLQQKLLRSGLHLRLGEFLMLQMGAIVVVVLLCIFRFGVGWQMFAGAVLAYFIPGFYVNNRMGKRMTQFSNSLPDVLMQISSSLRSGTSFKESVSRIAATYKGIVGEEFGKLNKELKLNSPQTEALDRMVKRVGNPEFELAAIAVGIHAKQGGNLAEILENNAETIRGRVKIKGKLKTLTEQARTSGYIITALPLILGVGLYFLLPSYFSPMVQSPLGFGLMVVGGISLGLGNFLMRKVAQVDI